MSRFQWEGRRPMNAYERALERFAATKAGGFYFVKIANRIDPAILRASRGRLSLSPGTPILLLGHTGAKSGARRETPLLYMTDGPRIVLIASNAGNARHPAWYHNVRAHPEVDVVAAGRSGRYRATVIEDEDERTRLWALAMDQYAGFDVYQERAGGRRIPIVALDPA